MTRRRNAFTLIELLVAVLLVVLVCLGTWMIHTGGWRSMLVTQKKLGAIRGAHLLFEVMHRDLKCARSLLVAPRVPDPETGKPGPSIFLIDNKEYVWDPTTGVLIVSGEKWILGLFTEIHLDQLTQGQVHVRIVSVSDEAAQNGPAGHDGIGGSGRTVVESTVTMDRLRGREVYPWVVEENRPYHKGCMEGDALDY